MEVPDVTLLPLIVKWAGKAPSSSWLDAYFVLMQRLLAATELDGDDPRLSVTVPKEGPFLFPVTVNNRYVLAARYGKMGCRLGIICDPDDVKELPVPLADIRSFFNPLPGETAADIPMWVSLNDPQTVLDSERIFGALVVRTRYEAARARATPTRRYHQDAAYRLAVDPAYRAFVLEEAFGEATIASPDRKTR